MKIINW